MSYIRFHAVLVGLPTYALHGDRQVPEIAAAVADFRDSLPADFRQLVIGPVAAVPGTQDRCFYVFLPDGSGEGFAASDEGDTYRRYFADLFAFRREDGSSPFEVVEVSWGDEKEYNQPPTVRDPRPPHCPGDCGCDHHGGCPGCSCACDPASADQAGGDPAGPGPARPRTCPCCGATRPGPPTDAQLAVDAAEAVIAEAADPALAALRRGFPAWTIWRRDVHWLALRGPGRPQEIPLARLLTDDGAVCALTPTEMFRRLLDATAEPGERIR